ncbi:MAG: hypothetical protein ACXWFC_14870 [Nitrososphaeraceae archaeon]
MASKSTTSTLQLIQPYMENFQKNFADIKSKSSSYLETSTEKDFFDLNHEITKLEYSKLVFPKKIRNQKSLRKMRKISKSLSKIERDLRAFELIDKEILNKKGSGGDQNYIKNFENTLKVRKQNLLSKSANIIQKIESVNLPIIDTQFDDKSLHKRTKKLSSNVDKLTKGIGKKVVKFDSDTIIVPKKNNVAKNMFKLQKRCEKLKLTLDTLTHLPQQSDIRGGGYQNTDNVVIKNCNKIHRILQDINSINFATSLLKQAGSEHYLMKAVDKINDDLQEKQRQFITMCKHFSDNKTLPGNETKVDASPKNV